MADQGHARLPILPHPSDFGIEDEAVLRYLRKLYEALFNDGTYRMEDTQGLIDYNLAKWDDLRVPVSAIKRLGFSDPDWVQVTDNGSGSTGVYALAFDGTAAVEEIFFSAQIPHNYKEGTDIIPHVHWGASDANSGDVRWSMEYIWANINGSFAGNTTIIHAVDSASGTAYDHQVKSWSAIPGTGKEISSMILCRLYRLYSHGDDTYAHDALLYEIDFHYQLDNNGSQEATSKL